MGRDKALLELNGESLLAKTCRTALTVSDSMFIVARSQKQFQEAIASLTISPESTRTISQSPQLVIDQKFDGALVGFWQGMEAIANSLTYQPDWILLLACDLPNLQDEILQTWVSQLRDLPSRAIAYLPRSVDQHSQKQWEPLCGFYRWQCRDSLKEFIKNGGRSFQKWLANQEVMEIENAPRSMLVNCNTPEEFAAIAKRSNPN
ncbi:molybdenum cofactor guanylyltransferase [Pseudanabaena sp. FACHB-1998]|nr:molybdenum cofactor guanylyltransferase [Pseudanabaena sp. FACHB-1998]